MFDKDLEPEFEYTTARSGGAGGQHVNKVSSKVMLKFNVANSTLLSESEKAIILRKLAHKITADGQLQVTSQQERSQLQNKRLCIQKLYLMLDQALKPVARRVKTKPTKASQQKRLQSKKIASMKKANRRNPDY